MMTDPIAIAERLIEGGAPVDRGEALWLAESAPFDELMLGAGRLRRHFCGDVVDLCSVINAKCGACSEDCAFCAQSARHQTQADIYPLVDTERMTGEAGAASERGADHFGIVTSGESVRADGRDFEAICSAVESIAKQGAVVPCASIGRLEPGALERLCSAGLRRIHHNLETSERFYPRICTTHSYAERVAMVRAAKAAGLEVCCGGLFGLGETWADRVDLALQLRELGVDSVPVNFLNPVPGTPLADRPLLEPRHALRIIALVRFVLPDRTIKVCGGREIVLRDLQSWMFAAGASGTMIGHYLTTAGREAADDLQMISDLGLTTRKHVK